MNLANLFRGQDNEKGRTLAAIGRSQAMIEVQPDRTIVSANQNFLQALGASVAAARAGKTGKGFALAADWSEF